VIILNNEKIRKNYFGANPKTLYTKTKNRNYKKDYRTSRVIHIRIPSSINFTFIRKYI